MGVIVVDNRRLLQIQSQRNVQANKTSNTQKQIESVVGECRRYIQDRADTYRNKDAEAKKNAIRELIIKYVMETKHTVAGFVDEDGKLDTNKLVDRLVEDITDYGILTKAMNDDDVYEIRCNNREIKVEIKGKVKDYTDENGNILRFQSPEQQDIVMRKILGDTRLTPKDAVINARSIEGYRIAAVHYSATSPDPNDPTNDKYHSFVLRKFKKSKMTLGDIVKKNTISDNMARLMALCTAGGLAFFTVGPTASGKTTTNNAILQSMPPTTRVVLLQNPSEIDLRMKDASGRIYNDVLHLEAREKENPSPTDPTMPNLMKHILRLSPTFVALGEIRDPNEFALALQILEAGHPINTTYHSETSAGAISRFLTAYMAFSGERIETALSTLTSLVNIIIVQKIMRDGNRKVIQISEVLGVDPKDKTKPLLNDLYVFDAAPPIYDNHGNIVEIPGRHRRVGKLSERTISKLKLEGVPECRFDFLLNDVDHSEEEEYTGDNIESYGMDKIVTR